MRPPGERPTWVRYTLASLVGLVWAALVVGLLLNDAPDLVLFAVAALGAGPLLGTLARDGLDLAGLGLTALVVSFATVALLAAFFSERGVGEADEWALARFVLLNWLPGWVVAPIVHWLWRRTAARRGQT